MFGKIVVNVITIVGGIKSHRIDRTCLRRRLRPWRNAFIEKPREVVIAKFAETGLGDVNKFQCGFHRGCESLAALGEILDSGTGGLCHLVKLASARVVLEREESSAEDKRLKLDKVHQNVGVETLVSGRVFEKFCHGVDYSKAAPEMAWRAR